MRSRTVRTACSRADNLSESAKSVDTRTHTDLPADSAGHWMFSMIPSSYRPVMRSSRTFGSCLGSSSVTTTAPLGRSGVVTVPFILRSRMLVSSSRLMSDALSSTALSRSML